MPKNALIIENSVCLDSDRLEIKFVLFKYLIVLYIAF